MRVEQHIHARRDWHGTAKLNNAATGRVTRNSLSERMQNKEGPEVMPAFPNQFDVAISAGASGAPIGVCWSLQYVPAAPASDTVIQLDYLKRAMDGLIGKPAMRRDHETAHWHRRLSRPSTAEGVASPSRDGAPSAIRRRPACWPRTAMAALGQRQWRNSD